jgi:rhodanese-related sulfurtransferase
MQRAFLLTILVLLAGTVFAQRPQYVCEPCGNSCDAAVYDTSGTCSHCGMALVPKSTVGFKDISFEQLCDILRKNPKVLLLDVRSPAEFAGTSTDVPSFGHFKNALNINVTELEGRVNELAKYKDREIIVYCSHSHRSPRASYYLWTHGFRNVKNMAGGVSTLDDNVGKLCLRDFYIKHDK